MPAQNIHAGIVKGFKSQQAFLPAAAKQHRQAPHCEQPKGGRLRNGNDLNTTHSGTTSVTCGKRALQKIDIDQLAQSVAISRRGLENLYRTTLQRSPHEEILHLRFEHAKSLLSHSHLSIDEIADASGFTSGHYLCDMFKRHIGSTPSAYRKNHFTK